MKKIYKSFYLFLLCINFMSAGHLFGQQVLYEVENTSIWESVYLQAGDRVKFHFTGSNRKANVYWETPSTTKEFGDRFEKAKDINTREWIATETGKHVIGMVWSLGRKGTLQLLRTPAAGKDAEPTTFMKRHYYKYTPLGAEIIAGERFEAVHKSKNFPSQDAKKNMYMPADEKLEKLPGEFNKDRSVVVIDSLLSPRILDVSGYSGTIHKIQFPFAFLKGDTVTYQIRCKKIAYMGDRYTVLIARPDQGVEGTAPDAFTCIKGHYQKLNEVSEGSFVVNHTGLISFYFPDEANYEIKILRYPASGKKESFTLPFKMVAVRRDPLYDAYNYEPVRESAYRLFATADLRQMRAEARKAGDEFTADDIFEEISTRWIDSAFHERDKSAIIEVYHNFLVQGGFIIGSFVEEDPGIMSNRYHYYDRKGGFVASVVVGKTNFSGTVSIRIVAKAKEIKEKVKDINQPDDNKGNVIAPAEHLNSLGLFEI